MTLVKARMEFPQPPENRIRPTLERESGDRLGESQAFTRAALAVQSDERLVALARAGSDAAFAAIVERYRRQLQRHSARIIGAGRAEDLVQQAFLNLYLQLRDDDRPLQLKPWLFRVTHNLSLNAAVKKGGDYEELSEDLDGVAQPPQVAELRARLRATVNVIGALPERQRIALVRRELEGRSCEEIAAEVGTSPVAVRQLLSRARSAVRDGVGVLLPFPLVARISGAGNVVAGAGALGGAAAVKVAVTVAALTAATGAAPGLPSAGSESPPTTENASHVAAGARPSPGPVKFEWRLHRRPQHEPELPILHQPPSLGSGEPLPQTVPVDPSSDPPNDDAPDETVVDEHTAGNAGSGMPIDEQEVAPYEEPPPDDPGGEESGFDASEGESLGAPPHAAANDDQQPSAPVQAPDDLNAPLMPELHEPELSP